MLDYQKLHYQRYYISNPNGTSVECTRAECFAVPEDLPGCPYKQRWFYDHEAGYAVRLPRTECGDAIGRKCQATLKKEERYAKRRATQESIDQPLHNEDGEDSPREYEDPRVSVEAEILSNDFVEQLNMLLSQLKEADRVLFEYMMRKAPKQEVADHFGITLDGVYYKEKQLRKRLKAHPSFQGLVDSQ